MALIIPRQLRIISRSRPSTCGFNLSGTELRKVFVERFYAYFNSRAWFTKLIKCLGQLCNVDWEHICLSLRLTIISGSISV
jgi:hypothetical protein